MTMSMMQPYLFPRLSYFQLFHASQTFVIFDTPRMMIKGWVRRNRIYEPNNSEGWKYINVPLVSKSQNLRILDARIDNTREWRERIVNQLRIYEGAEFFSETMELFYDCVRVESDFIVDFIENSLHLVCAHIGLSNFEMLRHSSLDVGKERALSPDDWALETATALGKKTYINPEGGRQLFSAHKYKEANINLKFLRTFENDPSSKFQESQGLSILHSLMHLGKARVGNMVSQNYLIVD